MQLISILVVWLIIYFDCEYIYKKFVNVETLFCIYFIANRIHSVENTFAYNSKTKWQLHVWENLFSRLTFIHHVNSDSIFHVRQICEMSPILDN